MEPSNMLKNLKKQIEYLESTPVSTAALQSILCDHAHQLAYILNSLDYKTSAPKDEYEGYISTMDFFIETRIAHPSTITRIFTEDPKILNKIGKRKGRKYMIKLQPAVDFFLSYPSCKLSTKAKRYMQNKIDQS